jgi:hypothetical protein
MFSSDLCLLLMYLVQVEFASPKELLENPKSFLCALVDKSADKEVLYAMANLGKDGAEAA